ncbi:class II fructose-bisphosphate aldolase [Arthrobacter woluwensis]|uniref:Fructose-bisphosphate aldolase n=1 Tax=Arthrobacter woluwensis TaxID=156980 RepID=A0A1H4KIV5_9MICC|nr:class II fructose-bisphosphate aldolase [Arthrobacter woluwensis]SEB58460.1 fructose-bisphosphate aldolase [Arthrobacter woluwensis]
MALVTTAELVADAQARRAAVVAFNVITLEHAQGILAGAERAGRPVTLQLSQNAVKYHGSPTAIAAAITAAARESRADASFHLDHVTDIDLVQRAAALGASSAMYDGAHLPFADNVAQTRAMVEWGAEHGVWIEAELGEIGGKDGAHAPGVRTDPAEARRFVEDTGVAALAVAVGSSHAMTEQTATLDLDLIQALAEAVPVPLVLHGSSGVPDDQLRSGAERGMVKINVGTALNVAYTGAVRSALAADPALTDPRKYSAPARAAVGDAVEHVLGVLA